MQTVRGATPYKLFPLEKKVRLKNQSRCKSKSKRRISFVKKIPGVVTEAAPKVVREPKITDGLTQRVIDHLTHKVGDRIIFETYLHQCFYDELDKRLQEEELLGKKKKRRKRSSSKKGSKRTSNKLYDDSTPGIFDFYPDNKVESSKCFDADNFEGCVFNSHCAKNALFEVYL